MFRSLARVLPRIGRTPRLCAAGLCLALALTSALGARRSSAQEPRSVPVVVAVHDLSAGHRLVRSDVRVDHWPPALRPAGAATATTKLVGQRTAGPVAAREALTSGRLIGAGLTRGLRRGLVAAAVALDDPHAAELVRSGDAVDLLESPRPPDFDTATPIRAPTVTTVVDHALVLAVLPRTADADAEVVLAVDRPHALRIERDRAAQVFAVVADPP